MTETSTAVCHACGGMAVHERDAMGVENRARCLLCGMVFPSEPPSWARLPTSGWTAPGPSAHPLARRLDEVSELAQRARVDLGLVERRVRARGGDVAADRACQRARRVLAEAEATFGQTRSAWTEHLAEVTRAYEEALGRRATRKAGGR